MYKLLQTGDESGTYPECWGSTATSDGREIAKSSTLKTLVEQALEEFPEHDEWRIMRGGKAVISRRREARAWLANH